MAAPCTRSPERSCGTVGPSASARRGFERVLSSHRPNQPVETGVPGTPLCQMSIDWKWL